MGVENKCNMIRDGCSDIILHIISSQWQDICLKYHHPLKGALWRRFFSLIKNNQTASLVLVVGILEEFQRESCRPSLSFERFGIPNPWCLVKTAHLGVGMLERQLRWLLWWCFL